jgi:hypothetical protein
VIATAPPPADGTLLAGIDADQGPVPGSREAQDGPERPMLVTADALATRVHRGMDPADAHERTSSPRRRLGIDVSSAGTMTTSSGGYVEEERGGPAWGPGGSASGPGGSACGPGPSGASAPSSRQRPSRNHRRIVRTEGGRAGLVRAATRLGGAAMTPTRASPPAKPRTPTSRTRGHPAERHTCMSETTMSRPARLRRNPGSRCAAQSHTDTPPGRCSGARFPWPLPTQIAHAGVDPRFGPL